jgi:hypothetical protein
MLIKYFQQMVLLLIIPTTIIMMMLTLRLQQMNMMMLTLRLQQMNTMMLTLPLQQMNTMMLTLQLHQMNTMMLTLRLQQMNAMMLIIQLQQMKLGINPQILGNLILLLLQFHNCLIKPLITMILILQFHQMNTMMLIIKLQQMKLGINPPILGHMMLLLLQLHNGLIKPLLQNWLQPLLLSGQLHQLSGQLHQLSGQLQAKLQHILIEKTMPDLINTDHLLYRRNSE